LKALFLNCPNKKKIPGKYKLIPSLAKKLKLLILCTLSTGLDSVAEVIRRGYKPAGLIGLPPSLGDHEKNSGYIDIASFARSSGIPFYYASSYPLKEDKDRKLFKKLDFDIIWVAGWQRLVPAWLIDKCRRGVLGVHGSPNGIHAGRGRSPQNWALMLGCKKFKLALFRITPGVDDGPVICQRSFRYLTEDDIRISYYRVSLATADMVCEVLKYPQTIANAVPQPKKGFYFPQRIPEDGWADWNLSIDEIVRHCRALCRPYPGLRTKNKKVEIKIWNCQRFDSRSDGPNGSISTNFISGEFLVNCGDGRLLVRRWSADSGNWRPEPKMQLLSFPFAEQLKTIIQRHNSKYPSLKINPRILAARSHSARRNRTEK
jgi:UDP-4-amino-4-deoxy-L-arabinose formyltransferase/UDP-glucuronic acid dehydrogenase (UDP-4-keto-hexauronic acid decarboxylating)